MTEIGTRDEYIDAANALAAAARRTLPLLNRTRGLLDAATFDHNGDLSDDQLEQLRTDRGVYDLERVAVAFGQVFDNLPMIENQLHCITGDADSLQRVYS